MTITKLQAIEIAKNSVSGNNAFRKSNAYVFSEDERIIVIELTTKELKDFSYRVKIDKEKRKILDIERA